MGQKNTTELVFLAEAMKLTRYVAGAGWEKLLVTITLRSQLNLAAGKRKAAGGKGKIVKKKNRKEKGKKACCIFLKNVHETQNFYHIL